MSVPPTYNSSFKFGYNGQWYNFKNSKADEFQVRYEKCLAETEDFRSECVKSAKIISSQTNNDIWLLYSGGADSEFMVRSFLAAGVKFKIAIVRFEKERNWHDIKWAIQLCNELQLNYEFLELDIYQFFKSKQAFVYAEKAKCSSPMMLYHFWAIDQIHFKNGFPVLAYGEPKFDKRVVDNKCIWDSADEELDSSSMRYLVAKDKPGCGAFFQFRSEIMLSYMRSPLIQKLFNNEMENIFDSSDIKWEFYRQYFDMQETPQDGYNGFEKVEDLFFDYYPHLYNRFGNSIYYIRAELLEEVLSPTGKNISGPLGKMWNGYSEGELFSAPPL